MTRVSVLTSLFVTAWRARRGLLLTYLLLLIADVVATGLFGLALRGLIRSALHGNVGNSMLASAVATICWTTTSAGSNARANMAFMLAESVSVKLDERILGAVGRSAGLEQLETPEYVDRLALLRSGGDLAAHYALGLLDVVTNFMRLVVVVALLTIVQPVLLLLALLLAPVLWAQRSGRKRVARSMISTAEEARLAEHLYSLHTEPTSAMEIRIIGASETLRERANQVWSSVVRQQESARWYAAALGICSWAVFMAGYAAALFSIARSVSTGRAEPGDVLLVLALTANLRKQAEDTVRQLARTAVGVHFVDAYLAVHADAAAAPTGSAATPAPLREGITFDGVSFTYPGAKGPVLNHLDLRLPAGSMVALVGEHGAGKTTLVKMLCGLYTPTSGSISVDGIPLARIPAERWRADCTASFQDFARFAWPVRESIGCGELAALDDSARIEQAMARADASEIVAGLPSGLDTRLGTLFGGVELSSGQWQRIALSRAFMRMSPVLFVLDEPTASLDAHSEYLVYQRQMAYARRLAAMSGAVTVVVSHRFSTIRMADRILVLSDGAVTEAGSHGELMALGGRYAELYNLQASGYRSDMAAVRIPPNLEGL